MALLVPAILVFTIFADPAAAVVADVARPIDFAEVRPILRGHCFPALRPGRQGLQGETRLRYARRGDPGNSFR